MPPDTSSPIIHFQVSKITDAQAQLPFIQLQTPSGEKIIALVDSGAQVSIIATKTAERLKMTVVGKRMTRYSGFVADSQPTECIFYKLEIKDLSGKCWSSCVPSYHRMTTEFRAPSHTREDLEKLKKWSLNTEGIIDLGTRDGQQIDMILGNNILNKIKSIERPKTYCLPSGRSIEKLMVGYVNHPPVMEDSFVPINESTQVNIVNDMEQIWIHTLDSEDMDLEEANANKVPSAVSNKKFEKQLEQLWSLEVIGIEPPTKREDKEALNNDLIKEFKRSAVKDPDGRIQVALPYNGRQNELGNNLAVAKRRLVSLLGRQLQKKEDREAYHQILMGQLASGIIEEVIPGTPADGPEYYIPHRVVIKQESLTTKLRIVLDASSHMKNQLSLNDCLYPGPSILQSILGILLRSRLPKFLMTADIEKAFHAVMVQEKFRDAMKFIWLKNPEEGFKESNIATYRFSRLPFGVTCSPFLLAVTILTYLDLDLDDFNERFLENLYVDNVMFTSNSEEDLMNCYTKSKSTCDKMHMNLREFMCNNGVVRAKIPEKDRSAQTTGKLLGHQWNSEEDTIHIKIATPPEGIPTKRDIVAFNATTYDPSGLLSPILVLLKRFITIMWEKDIDWDQKIPQDMWPLWKTVAAQFTEKVYSMPRQLVTNYDYDSIQLAVFSDASKYHYATTAYLRFGFKNERFESKLIFAKSRVRPSSGGSEYSIPRMELVALEIGVNSAVNIANELHIKIKDVNIFSDSTCCLYWILSKVSNNLGSVWVANRVKKIHQNAQVLREEGIPITFRYVPTDENPADIASRGCSIQELKESDLWHKGPKFLSEREDRWPKKLDNTIADPHAFREQARSLGIIPSSAPEKSTTLLKVEVNRQLPVYSSIVPYERTNSMSKLTKTIRKVCKWICYIVEKRNRRHPEKTINFTGSMLKKFKEAFEANNSVEETLLARKFIIQDHYIDAKERLNETPSSRMTPAVFDEGIWRFSTRFSNAEDERITPEMRHPIIIISKHRLATLIVQEAHENLHHQGIQDVITEVHRRYWIESIGLIVKSIRRRCVTCQKKHGLPFEYNYTRILPPSRTTMESPFKHIGLDYIGPLPFKLGQRLGKVWVLLLTCLVTRAVHLEIVSDNTTVGFINGLKRFIARRGAPSSILSDNAPQFKLGYRMINKDLKTYVNQDPSLTTFLARHEIKIKLITPMSPWQGGIYERLVGIVKNILLKVLGKGHHTFLELETLLIETEGIVNSRPITSNKKDIEDSPAIRPIDFIAPNVCLALPEKTDTTTGEDKAGQTEVKWRTLLDGLTRVKQRLWEEFTKRYFHTLREFTPRKGAHSRIKPRVGQLVLVEFPIIPRHTWPLGVITEVTRTKDGEARSVMVKTMDSTVEKSINQLIPLEDPEYEEEKNTLSVPRNIPQPDTSSIIPTPGDKESGSNSTSQAAQAKANCPAKTPQTVKRGPGRPKKWTGLYHIKPRPKALAQATKRGRGRPKGSTKGPTTIPKTQAPPTPRRSARLCQKAKSDLEERSDGATGAAKEGKEPKSTASPKRAILSRGRRDQKTWKARIAQAVQDHINLLSSVSPGKKVHPTPGMSRP
ncbi:hypothetical protein CRE_19915 [Caenorhabditis remanei]|uniref:Integrase catalytic domain-containing protein n=1 Tax=Caenorhabditis remanei TaxID=31234 RepID=E3N2Y9_CAERE|nr:hypothetical protein CRE_19915 [Caenorhabditis remanei]